MKRTSARIRKLKAADENVCNATNSKENSIQEKIPKKIKIEQKRPKNIKQTISSLHSMKNELRQLEDPPLSDWEKKICSARLSYSFYDFPCEILAKNMLGKILVRKLEDGTILRGKIVETECYIGIIDKASATYQGKVTSRNIPMYMAPGTIFVYRTYGMYHCFNISSQGEGSSVFLRAVEPLVGIERMKEHRNLKLNTKTSKKSENKSYKPHELCNGPSKLCIAFNITAEHSKYSMCSWKGMWIEDDLKQEDLKIVSCPRIGIDSAGAEWANKPLRFYILNNQSVSKRDKKAEKESFTNT